MATRTRAGAEAIRSLDAFQTYTDRLATAMALRDWSIRIGEGPPTDPDADAAIHLVPGRKVARIWLSEETLSAASVEEQRHTLVHELIHCHFNLVDALVAGEEVRRIVLMCLEYGIDGLADAIAPRMPLPG